MVIISRFKFVPLSHSDYLKNYVNSLKTGEMLVDLTNHDVYVTEEGVNIPIPTTKALRDEVVNFLNNDLEGIRLKNSSLERLDRLQVSIKAAKDQADNAYNTALDYSGVPESFESDRLYLTDVNAKTINQLGDLKINLDNITDLNLKERLQNAINEFNRVNIDGRSTLYTTTIGSSNTYLLELWNEIVSLMDQVNRKLNRLGSFSGSVKLKRNATRTIEAFDCTYSRRLQNFTGWAYVGSADQYVATTSTSQGKFEAWFRGEAYQDLRRSDMLVGYEQGTGLWYKNFPHKVDIATGSYLARPYGEWDLFEVVPLSDFSSLSPGWNINYVLSVSNVILPDADAKGAYASAGAWTTRMTFNKYSVDMSKFGYGSDWWRQPVSSHGASTVTTSDSLMSRVADMNDKYGFQRTPKQTYHSGITSRYAPALATMVRAVPYYSSVGIPNTDGITIRLGLRKTVRETVLEYASYQYDGSAWIRK